MTWVASEQIEAALNALGFTKNSGAEGGLLEFVCGDIRLIYVPFDGFVDLRFVVEDISCEAGEAVAEKLRDWLATQ